MTDAAIAERRRALATDALRSAKGVKEYVSFEPVSAHYGERWPELVDRAKILADAVLRRELGPHDFYVEDGDVGLYLVFNDPGATPEAIARHADRVRAEILQVLLGGEDLPDEDAGPEVAVAPASDDAPGSGAADADDAFAALAARAGAVVREAYVEAGDGTEDDVAERALEWRSAAVGQESAPFGASDDKATSAAPLAESVEKPVDEAAESTIDSVVRDLAAVAEADAAAPVAIDVRPSDARAAPDADVRPSDARAAPDADVEASEDRVGSGTAAAPQTSARDAVFGVEASVDLPVDAAPAPSARDRADAEPMVGAASDPAATLDGAASDDRPTADIVLEAGTPPVDGPAAFGSSDRRGDAAVAFASSDLSPADDTPAVAASDDRGAAGAESAFGDRPSDGSADATASSTRIEPTTSFEASEDPPDIAFDVAAAGERDADGPVPASSADRGGSDASVVGSATRPDVTPDVGSSRDRIDDVLAPPRSDALPEHRRASPIALDLVPPIEAAFGAWDARAELDADWAASGTRAAPDAIAARAEDRVEGGAPQVPIAGARDAGDPTVAPSAPRVEPGFDAGRSEARPDQGPSDVPESMDRGEAAGSFEATSERVDGAPDVARSETRVSAAADFGAAVERGDTPPEWGETHEHAPPAQPVAASAERSAAAPEFALSADKPIDPAAMIRQRRYDPALLTNITLRYTAFWDVRRQLVSTYAVTPIKSDDGVRIDSPSDLIAAARSDAAANALDLMLLAHAVDAAAEPIRRGARFILALPISAASLARPRLRARYLATWSAVPEPVRGRTRLVCHHLDGDAADATLTEVVQVMRQLARAPMLQLSWRSNLLPRLGGLGVDAVALDLSELGEVEWAEVDRRLFSAVGRAHTLGIKVFVAGLADASVARKVLTMGVDFLASGVIDSLGALPTALTQISRERYLDGVAAAAKGGPTSLNAAPSTRP